MMLSLLLLSALPAVSGDDILRAQQLLAEAGLGSEPADLVSVLQRRIASPDDLRQIAIWIEQLSSSRFQSREQATQQLIVAGQKAAAAVAAAQMEAVFPESRERLKHIGSQIGSRRDDGLLWAALVELKRHRAPGAVDPLLRVLPQLPSRHLQAPAKEALWASVGAQHGQKLRKQLEQGTTVQRAAALVGWERVTGRSNLALAHADDLAVELRLAAARSLTAHQPIVATTLLVKLRESKRRDIQAESEYLLQAIHQVVEEQMPTGRMDVAKWRSWARQRRTQLAPLGDQRFRCGALELGIREEFEQPATSVVKGYGSFFYESTVTAKAAVVNGILLLDGDHVEGDQRLAISAESLCSNPLLTEPFTVQTRIGGKAGNEVGWHVGVSVGNIKALFHPGYRGGAFRIETVDQHQYLLPNAAMPFTPASDELHTMRIRVRPRADGGADMTVNVIQSKSDKSFTCNIRLEAKQLGSLNRIGLERSGRSGGAAMFDDLEIVLE